MFLKTLHIAGFKSFAQPVGIDLGPGVTGIVGPNGSGKSNIVDAVRWVLGEQSARAIRGARSEDVIFSGSAMRHAQGMAEVKISERAARQATNADVRKFAEQMINDHKKSNQRLMTLANAMKLGVGTAHGARLGQGGCEVHISIQRVHNSPRHVELARDVTPSQIEDAVTWSARFMRFVSRVVESHELPKLKTEQGTG